MLSRYKFILHNQQNLLDKARVKILFICILTFFIIRLSLLAIHLQTEAPAKPFFATQIFPVIWFICLSVFLFARSWKIAAHFFLIFLTLISWSSTLLVEEWINIVIAQYCFIVLSCGYYLLGPHKGFLYAWLTILPLVSKIILKNYFNYQLPGNNFTPNQFSFTILIVSNFLLLAYIHYSFFQTLLSIDQKKHALKSDLEQAMAQSRLQTAAKSNFLLTMSHQLRTPLNVVQGATSMLLTGVQLPEQKEAFKILDFSTTNLLATIDQIVDFTDLERGGIQLINKPFYPGELFNNIYQSFRPGADQKKLKFAFSSDLTITDIKLSGDAFRLGQILFHLLENAVKFTEIGQISLRLRAERRDSDSIRLSVSVSDTGIGISEQKLARVIDPFQLTPAESRRQSHGTLGLTIAYQLVRLHGQELIIESKEGYGTKVSFSLTYPLVEGDLPSQNSLVPAIRILAGFRILVVDDEPLNILVMRRLLERWGITVDSCFDGIQALEKVENFDYDLILMDINMPKMDGFEASKRIRKIPFPSKASIPILAVTASTEAITQGHQKTSDIDDYLMKPIKPDDLWQKIQTFLMQKNTWQN
ncbi:response regulator [Dyadobacter subterraneus]|uniref:histidine kinase n=1 Tax=Dyadobacter subterraneus TaxID=2773304 RepID=A0ABR9WE46_9BACT|nr:response regulator [Dyadobacter subterraneus]MBE9463760.1 response regulator [Dyadobacter subterraneus]